ncbi:NADH:flavin oxidoreductase [Planctomycetota bacterium]|nr:NADH:flavin oxidoreductase [Planctomycetota bacterium]
MPTNHPALKPFKLGQHQLINRAAIAPMSRVSTLGDGVPTNLMTDYYLNFAQGQFGLIITEGAYTDRQFSQAYPNQPGITKKQQQSAWQNLASAIRQTDSKIILQLMHAGALSQHLSNTRAPSAIQPLRRGLPGYSKHQSPFPKPHALNLDEIDSIIQTFTLAAQRAQDAGFHGIEVHAANGYLLDQFITDYTNTREDHYGSTPKNRIRLTIEIIHSIKQATNQNFITGVRLSQGKVNDFNYLWPNGAQDANIIFPAVAQAGADYIHFASEGNGFFTDSFTRDNQSLPKLARDLTNLPVIANGGLHDPSLAHQVLTEQHADLISIGLGALTNPDWPRKLAQNIPITPFTPDFFSQGVDIQSAPTPQLNLQPSA